MSNKIHHFAHWISAAFGASPRTSTRVLAVSVFFVMIFFRVYVRGRTSVWATMQRLLCVKKKILWICNFFIEPTISSYGKQKLILDVPGGDFWGFFYIKNSSIYIVEINSTKRFGYFSTNGKKKYSFGFLDRIEKITCTAFFIFAIILGFLALLASDLLLGLKASKRTVFRVGLAVSSPLLRLSALLLLLLLRLFEPERVPEAFPRPLLDPDELEAASNCWGTGVVFPEPGALPDVGFLMVFEWEPQVPVPIEKHFL